MCDRTLPASLDGPGVGAIVLESQDDGREAKVDFGMIFDRDSLSVGQEEHSVTSSLRYYYTVPKMAAQYPEALPPRQPSALARIFSIFPLVTLPPATSSIEVTHAPTRPVLYVAPGHPRAPSSSSAGPSTSTTWTSSDVRCLRKQADLTFRGIDFDVDQIPSQEAWGPSSSRNALPFLHLPSIHKGTTATSSNGLLGDDGLSVWAENNGPLPFERKEDGNEKRDTAGAPFASVDVKEEALAWSALLENGLMAAVVSDHARLFSINQSLNNPSS